MSAWDIFELAVVTWLACKLQYFLWKAGEQMLHNEAEVFQGCIEL